ncbi:MAG: SRPBCC family protein [Anaerolineales bacterium]|jgi:hypothetical protein
MTTVVKTNQVLVHTLLQSTFEYVSDLSLHPEWNYGLRIEAVEPGSIAVGKEYTSHGVVMVQKDRANRVRVSHYEPPHKFGFTSTDPDFGEISHVFTFSEQNGDVLITRTMTIDMNSVMAILFNIFVYPLISRPSMTNSMAALKIKLEGKK